MNQIAAGLVESKLMHTSTLGTERLPSCPICGGTSSALLPGVRDFETDTGVYDIDVCKMCNTAFTNPRPLESELWKLYVSRKTSDFAPGKAGLADHLRNGLIRQRLRRTLQPHPSHVLRILDYGCGDGSLIAGAARLARHDGFALEAVGVDFHDLPPPALSTPSAGVVYIDAGAWEAMEERYDHIFLRHVLEHHSRPQELLCKLATRLKPGGRIHIEVPNRCSLWARVFGRHFFPYYVPRHLFHFDSASLERVVALAGLNISSIRRGHTPALGRSLGWRLSRDIDNLGLLGLSTYPLQVALDVVAGRSTTLLATAHRD